MPNEGRATSNSQPDDPVEMVREALKRLRYGSISLIVHEGRLTQFEITEKRRFGH